MNQLICWVHKSKLFHKGFYSDNKFWFQSLKSYDAHYFSLPNFFFVFFFLTDDNYIADDSISANRMYANLLENYVFLFIFFIALHALCWFFTSTQLVHTGRCLRLNGLRLTKTHKVKVTNAFLQIYWKYTTKLFLFSSFRFFFALQNTWFIPY